MLTIHKETLLNLNKLTVKTVIQCPVGAKFLAVGAQYNQLALWYECDPTQPQLDHTILIVGTGHEVPIGPRLYIGTVLFQGGDLVLHVYELL